MSILNKFLGDANERELKKIQPLVDKINKLEPEFKRFSDEELKQKSEELKAKVRPLERDLASQDRYSRDQTLNSILPEAFALVRESAKRTLGQRHFDSQLIGGIVLHQGKIAEMKTGEGKTLAATLAVYLNALAGKGAHIITVNDYLSRRDANWMGPIYHLLGLTCSCLNHEKAYIFAPEAKPDDDEVSVEMENLKEVTRQEAYQADITYGTNNEFGFDYLRDNMAPDVKAMVQRSPNFAIIDEVDSILVDEARTPLIISMPDADSTKLYEQFSKIIPRLEENEDYNIDEKAKAATLTELGIAKIEKILGMDNIYEQGGIRYVHHLEQALRAQVLFKRDKNYVVKDNQVIIVDEFTGRLMPGRRYSEGLHQALEAKEKVQVQQESRTLASITFQNYFRMYPKLAGMTGTAITSAEEFHKVYKLEAIVIPTNKPMIRQDLPDSVYKTEKGKFESIAREVKQRHEKGQPVLIGTVSIEKNELLSAHLKKAGVPHQILNAKNHEQEAKIISQAGQKGAVTVATNMAGRGVDIVLGDGITKLGGLYVIGTERHEARRIDDQLRGRSGRQGDPGLSQFFVCLEDDLMRIFGGDKIKSMMDMLKVPEDQPIENKMVSRAIESAQEKIEGFNFDVRKHILEYDDVMNKQREIIYKKRRDILTKKNLKKQVLEMIMEEIGKFVQFHSQENINYKEIAEIAKSIFPVSTGRLVIENDDPLQSKGRHFQDEPLEKALEKLGDSAKISEYLIGLAEKAYQGKEKELEEKNMRQIEKYVLLRSMDTLWMDHLDNMDHLRDSVRLRAYGQKDPLVEYKNEGIKMFQQLLGAIQATTVNMIYKVALAPASQQDVIASGAKQSHDKKKLGRNSPCPCGSNKKYKKCCYPKYGR